MAKRQQRLPCLLALLLLAGCASWRAELRPAVERVACGCDGAPPDADAVEIRYLGASGFLVRRGDAALLTAPFFSNPGLLRAVLNLPVAPNPARVAHGVAGAGPGLADVRAILVGHGHYDHLMDVPLVAREIARRNGGAVPVIYGSRTVAHVLAGIPELDATVVVVNDAAGTWRRAGRWLQDGEARAAFRFMALHSEHAPQFAGFRAFRGKLREPRTTPPRRAGDWLEGQTFAWVIDVLGPGGEVDFRIHFQDAASTPPWGFPPRFEQRDERPWDVTILCGGAFDEATDYPEALVRELRPGHAILSHWEDFFRDPGRDPRPLSTFDAHAFATRLESALPSESQWTTPRPGATLRFCLPPQGAWRATRPPRCR